jgi:hypothetical protein
VREFIQNKNDIMKLKDDVARSRQEAHILMKSLHNSYYKYASITSRKILDLLADLIYYNHAQRSNTNTCPISLVDLQDENNKKDRNACINHFLNCKLHFESLDQEFQQLFSVRSNLNEFVHSLSGLNEIVVSHTLKNPVEITVMIRKVIGHLKTKFPNNPYVQLLPNQIIDLDTNMDPQKIVQFECYKQAFNEVQHLMI